MVCRELTKTHEEIKRGTLAELADWAARLSGADPRETRKKKASGAVRGEITLVVAGAARRRRRLLTAGNDLGGLPGPAGPLPPLP